VSRRTLAVTGLVAGALFSGGCSLPGRVGGPVALTAVFEDTSDLVAHHAVQVADVRVGSISTIELTDDYRARVTLEIKDDLELPADSVAVLRQTSLLGEKFVELRPRTDDDDCGDAPRPEGVLTDGATITCTIQAPELESVTEQAVEILSVVAANRVEDLQTLIETGAVGFGGRAEELRALIDDLITISGTLADQTANIVAIIDGLDSAAGTLADGAPELDGLLTSLADATTVLADNREEAIATLQQLTRLARVQNDLVFEPYLDATMRQLEQVDAIVARVVDGRGEVGLLLDWLARFVEQVPLAIPCRPPVDATQPCSGGDFAQVYGWFVPAPAE
jgi:phospholipid/cholesterol/gamma-HCH transport system substrate-binding protein